MANSAEPLLENNDWRQKLANIVSPTKPCDLTVMQTLRELFHRLSSPHSSILGDMCIVKILRETLTTYRDCMYDCDEEDEACIFRLGYVQTTIPYHILEPWEKTKTIQKGVLKEMIQEKQ